MRQGSQLSALLFSCFINDWPAYLNEIDTHAPSFGKEEVKTLLYADDVAVFSLTKVDLKRALKKLNQYSLDWGIEVNTKKTKIVTFTNGRRVVENQSWFYNHEKRS